MHKLIILALTGVFLVACATSAPVIYQNKTTTQVGEAQVQSDIDACVAEAESKGLDPTHGPGSEVAKDTVRGGAVGGATGAVTGAIAGNAGSGAKYGAAAGATAGLLRGLFKDSKPNSVYRRYVERCLVDLGYDVVGWN